MRTLWQDARFALRTLRKSPGFAAIVIATLALGIGVNTAMFSVANAVLWGSLPYAQPERLVTVAEVEPGDRDAVWGATYPTFRDWQAQAGSLESMAAISWTSRVLREGSEPVLVRGATVSHEFFPVLGVQPELGRVITAEDDRAGASAVIVLSHEMWTTRFGADPAILGRAIHFDGLAPTVVGVMPASFRYPPKTEYWLPMAAVTSPRLMARRDVWMLSTIGRLRPGRTEQNVASEISGITAAVLQAHPEARRGLIISARLLRDDLGSDLRPALLSHAGRRGRGPPDCMRKCGVAHARAGDGEDTGTGYPRRARGRQAAPGPPAFHRGSHTRDVRRNRRGGSGGIGYPIAAAAEQRLASRQRSDQRFGSALRSDRNRLHLLAVRRLACDAGDACGNGRCLAQRFSRQPKPPASRRTASSGYRRRWLCASCCWSRRRFCSRAGSGCCAWIRVFAPTALRPCGSACPLLIRMTPRSRAFTLELPLSLLPSLPSPA